MMIEQEKQHSSDTENNATSPNGYNSVRTSAIGLVNDIEMICYFKIE